MIMAIERIEGLAQYAEEQLRIVHEEGFNGPIHCARGALMDIIDSLKVLKSGLITLTEE